MITVRTHKINRQSQSGQFPDPTLLETQPIPINIRDQARLFDDLWFNFINHKNKIDRQREELAPKCRGKGSLKSQVPLVWLSWQRWDGKQGQTRNQENWDRTWKNLVERTYQDGSGRTWRQPVAWVTLVRYVDPAEEDIPLSPPLSSSSSESSNSLSSPPLTPLFFPCSTTLGQDVSALQGVNRWNGSPTNSTFRRPQSWDGATSQQRMYQTPLWPHR